MVSHVFADKTPGDPVQELGGAMVTLAVLAETNKLNMMEAGEVELARCRERIDLIRAKTATKDRRWVSSDVFMNKRADGVR